MWIRLCVFQICCAVVAHSWARDIYVNNVTGDDRYDGTAAITEGGHTGPDRTITRAL